MIFIPGVDSIEFVLQVRAQALQALAAGSQVVSWASEGTSVTKQSTMSVKEVLKECADFLKTVEPDTYGGRRIRRTQPFYRS